MSNVFSLKQFDIRQDRAAMKVGTDGLLLGAWAQGGRRILDIGTGTGLVALMMAQRFPDAHIDAIDIDEDAASQAAENVAISPFADMVSVKCISLQDYYPLEQYDSIVCNPPFFTHSLLSPDRKRTLARHSVSLPFDELFLHAHRLMSCNCLFSIIVPVDASSQIEINAAMNSLFLVRRCLVRTTPKKPPRRMLLTFSPSPSPVVEEEGVIQNTVSEPTEWYSKHVHDFLLNF